ncbi:restriction endonuclease subunit S [Burkholderia pseudomallei]|uniref:restriction endonuclease subunit S n=1 Tax=Burkholderia pseudomallei TaxID=28450 RepID=UPI000538872C|nr:hypothetical protein [Burkholderia pseudomallei]KGW56879.1 putative type I restriction-modification methylase S subunit [Burkholderia pseudomallei MSHR1357]KKC13943.1 putative type I restriction-modification methylase S subunit [Burkholderia pseudomallei MSHR1328]
MLWQEKRLRFVADLNPPVRVDLLETPDAELSFLPMESIGEDGTLNLERTRPVAEVRNGYSYFENGDVAFAKVTPCFENGKGAVMRNLEGGAGFGTTELTVLRPKADTNARFLNYVVLSERFRQLGAAAMLGAGGLKRVPDEFTRDFATPWPDVTAQERAANFLDEKTTRIDALIAEKERLISTVEEYEHSAISKLIMAGVTGKPLEETGRVFVPKAPDDWRVATFKRALIGMNQGWSPQCEGRPAEDHEWGVLKVGCVNGGRFDAQENKALPADLEPDLSCVLRKGDVLMSRANTRELVGLAALVEEDYPNLLLCDKLYRLELRPDWILPEFAVLLLRSDTSRQQIELGASGASSSMQNISQDVVRELEMAFPPVGEQSAIVVKAREIRDACHQLIAHCESHIERLREYRSSLISAVVTGQLGVDSLGCSELEAA